MTEQKKREPRKVPEIKIDKGSAKKSIINFHQSLKMIQSHL